MTQERTSLIPAFLSIGILGLSLGISMPILALAMERIGATVTLVGLSILVANGAALVSSLLTPPAIERVGGKNVMIWGMAFLCIVIFLYAAARNVGHYFFLRGIFGLLMGFIFVTTEAYIIALSDPARRVRNMGIYGVAIAAGSALGPIMAFRLYEMGERLPFYAGAAICVLPLLTVIILLKPYAPPKREGLRRLSPMAIFIPIISAMIFGLIYDGILGLIALYLENGGFLLSQMGLIVTSFLVGGIVLQYPLCMVADRTNKHIFLVVTAVIGAAGFFLCPWFHNPLPLMIATFFSGGIVSTTYPVGMAILGDDIAEEYVTQGAAYMSVGFSMGAIAGPYFLSLMMDWFNYRYLFFSISAALVVYGAVTVVSFARDGGRSPAQSPDNTP